MKIKAVLFDMDGVLIDSYESWFNLFNYTLKSFGLKEVTDKEFKENVWAKDFSLVTHQYFNGKSVKEVANFYFQNFLKFKKYIKLLPGVKDVLKRLRQLKLRIAVVSNTYHNITEHLLSSVSLLRYFNIIVGGDDVKKGKPAPDMIIKACNLLKIQPKEAILIGDTIFDIMAGKKAGCFTIGLGIKGDIKINKLKELLNIIC